MAKQIHGSLSSRSKSKSGGLSLRIILLVVLVVAVSVGAILWFALLQSIQDQQQHGQQVSSTVTSSAVQKLRSVRAKVQLASRKEADAGHKAEALQPTTKQSVVLKTTVGDIDIVLRPDLSAESVDYIRQIAALNDCANCKLYRAEKPGILQGIIANRKKVPVNTIKGSCPPGYQDVPNECPEWDKNCACHGPVRGCSINEYRVCWTMCVVSLAVIHAR